MKFAHPIYPVTNQELSGMSHAEQVRCLVETGVGLIQIREKNADSASFFDDAKKALSIARKAGVKLIINDRVDIALALGADGVHLGQNDLPPDKARRLLGADSIIGYSTHTVEQAIEANDQPIDYIAVGPVFETSTKVDPDEVTGLDTIVKIRTLSLKVPLVAIGGIDALNISKVAEAGADSAAIVSAIWQPRDTPVQNITRLKKHWTINIV